MIRTLFKRALASAGLELRRIPRAKPAAGGAGPTAGAAAVPPIMAKIIKDPLNPDLHFEHARIAADNGRPFLAYSEAKTAQYLGASGAELRNALASYRSAIPELTTMNHNQYYRFITLADEIMAGREHEAVSVLDVGGADGQLAAFLPESYAFCLVDPDVNGISGIELPFADGSFDYVVSCHVLEHIPPQERRTFLDQLLAKARKGVILLNPFHVEGTHVEERLQLIIDLLNAPWAREHLECSLPRVGDLEAYAAEKRLGIKVQPNGSMTTTMALVFVDAFARQAQSIDPWMELNRFYNTKLRGVMDSEAYPNAYLIHLMRPDAGAGS